MKIEIVKGISKKDLVQATAGESNLKELVGVDSFRLYGAALCQQVDNTTGQVTGSVVVRTDLGVYAGISRQVYNAIETMLELYTAAEFKGGIECRIVSSDVDSDRAYLRLEIL